MIPEAFFQSDDEHAADLSTGSDEALSGLAQWQRPQHCQRLAGGESLLQCVIECVSCDTHEHCPSQEKISRKDLRDRLGVDAVRKPAKQPKPKAKARAA